MTIKSPLALMRILDIKTIEWEATEPIYPRILEDGKLLLRIS